MIKYDKHITLSNNENINDRTNLNYEPAEVVDIIYDNTHPLYKTDLDIGSILFRRLYTDFNKKYNDLFLAKPINPYIKIYPLRYEFVSIYESIAPPSGTYKQITTYYYDNTINIWNIINNNALPFATISTDRQNQNDYPALQGSNSDKNKGIILGDYFKEKSIINKLQPFEGDIIFEGRFGQSIRFSNNTTPNSNNFWSKQGNSGDPLILINTTKGTNSKFAFRVEDINDDDNNILLSTSQTIPFKITGKEDKGYIKNYTPEKVNKYNKPQIIINSDRIILNAKKDAIIISAEKSIYNTSNDNIILHATNYIGVNSDKIYLGDIIAGKEKEPNVLGTQLLNTLIEIIDNILTMYVGTAVGPSTPILPPAQTNFITMKTKLSTMKYILSKKIYVE